MREVVTEQKVYGCVGSDMVEEVRVMFRTDG